MNDRRTRWRAALVLIVSLFFLWGMANNLNDILIKQFKKAFVLTDLETGLVQSAFYFGYFVFALPAGAVVRRFGYKAAVLTGLGLYGAGALLFYPAAAVALYPPFLLALFVIAAGLAFLETSANPLIALLGPPEGATRRLNLAQAFNPAGSVTGLLIGKYLILSGIEHDEQAVAGMSAATLEGIRRTEAAAVQGPYVAIGVFVLLWAALVAVTRFPPQAARPVGGARGAKGAIGRLLSRPGFTGGVVAQFFYVGAQVSLWSFTIRYAQATAGLGERAAADWVIAATLLFLGGRFAGAALMTRIAPLRLLSVHAAAALVLSLVAVAVPGLVGLVALTAVSFFMSIMFPTIFATGLRDAGEDAPTASAAMVMAIIGGAILTPVTGAVSTQVGIAAAMAVPAVAFLVILLYARAALRRPAAA